VPVLAKPGNLVQIGVRIREMGDGGLELPGFPAGKSEVAGSGGNKSGNTGARIGDSAGVATPSDPELAAVVAAWPDLPPGIRAGVLALVKAVTHTTPPTPPSGPAWETGGPTT
jgi:hypothetical protein